MYFLETPLDSLKKHTLKSPTTLTEQKLKLAISSWYFS